MKRILPPLLLILTWMLMIVANLVLPSGDLFPMPLRLVGVFITVLGALIAANGAQMFKRVGTNIKTFDAPQKLVTTGLFAHSRNPMYLGFALCALGGAAALGSSAPLIIAVLFCVILDRWYVQFEEAVMRKTFGQDYEAYCRRVRRWF